MTTTEGSFEQRDSAIGDIAGAPSWPIAPTQTTPQLEPPPVGLNWGEVARTLQIDLNVLLHDGSIVLTGEFFPERGYAFDPATLSARRVQLGEMALRPCYFIGRLTLNEFGVTVAESSEETAAPHPIIKSTRGSIIGLFPSRNLAERARDQILKASLGSGLTLEEGPLGVELHVHRPELPGRVATLIAHRRGAVISIGGTPVLVTTASE